jgi:periplasmic protein CpxP/Spy
MNKTKLLWTLLILCLLSNGILLFRTMRSQHPPHHREPKHRIIEALHLDDTQQMNYAQLIGDHRNEVTHLERQIANERLKMYLALDSVNSPSDDGVQRIGQLQMQMEQVHYRHFHEIRMLCREDQWPLYDALVHEFPELFMPSKRGKR